MNRTKRIKNILKNNFLEYEIKVIDDSFSHKGHYNFNGKQVGFIWYFLFFK